MPALIPLHDQPMNAAVKQTVNARDLHEFLEVGRVFSSWILGRIKTYGFVEDIDFVKHTHLGESNNPAIDYFLTLDMAKELSMVERTNKGKEARQYFIDCERQLKATSSPASLSPAQVVLHLAQQLVTQETQLAEHAHRLALLEANAAQHADYVSLKGYAALCHRRCTNAQLQTYGKQASAYARTLGMTIGEIPDEKWGKVHTYPLDMLDECLQWREETS